MQLATDTETILVLIEFSPSHAECLWTQIVLARALGREPLVVAHPDIAARAPTILPGVEVWPFEAPRSIAGRLRALARLGRRLADRGVRDVVFNTCSGSLVRDFLMVSRRRFAYAGVLHNAGKLRGSATQGFITLFVKRYGVLSEHVLEHARPRAGVRLSHFYPVYFPDSLLDGTATQPGFRVVVPGGLELGRRDYAALFAGLSGRALPPDFVLVLLGSVTGGAGGRDIVDRFARDAGLHGRVVSFDGFVDDRTFFAELGNAALVLPLNHPGTGRFERYFRVQVTGAWNLAFGVRRPLLMHRAFERYRVFRETALFYDPDHLAERLLELHDQPRLLEDARERIRNYGEFALESQVTQYARLLGEREPRPSGAAE